MSRTRSIVIIMFIMVFMTLSFMLFEQLSSYVINDIVEQLRQLGKSNIWISLLMVLVLMLDVLLPIPSSLVAVYVGTTFGFVGGAIIIWYGLMAGCLFGYWLGRGVRKVLSPCWLSQKEIDKAYILSKSLDSVALVLMRGIPVMAETSVIAAGMVQYPFFKFILLTGTANAGIAIAYAFVGSQISDDISLMVILAASISLPVLALAIKLLFDTLFGSKNPGLASLVVRPMSGTSALVNNTDLDKISACFQVDYTYDVLSTNKAFTFDNLMLLEIIQQGNILDNEQKVLCVIDEGIIQQRPGFISQVENYFASSLHKKQLPNVVCQALVISGGEACKNQANVDSLIEHMLSLNLDRQSWVIAIGGGALLDCTGFACSVFHRGIRLIRMPSTVLGQNDAGIGVKNGINGHQQKNILGSFTPPYVVVNDADLLTSLNDRDKRSGLAEAIKVALIKDADFFYWLEKNVDKLSQFDVATSLYAIKRCVQCHIDHIAHNGDPFERGNGRPLDYGHWSAHKLENLSAYQLRHGEAVAIGIVLDALYAREIGWLDTHKTQRIIHLIQGLGFTIWHDTLELNNAQGKPVFMDGLEDFRQHLGGKLSIPVLIDIGCYRNVDTISHDSMLAALTAMKNLRIQKGVA